MSIYRLCMKSVVLNHEYFYKLLTKYEMYFLLVQELYEVDDRPFVNERRENTQ